MPIGDQAVDLMRSDVAASAVKSAVPVSVAGLTWFGVPLSDWVMALTIIYTVLQIIFLVRDKLFRHRRRK